MNALDDMHVAIARMEAQLHRCRMAKHQDNALRALQEVTDRLVIRLIQIQETAEKFK